MMVCKQVACAGPAVRSSAVSSYALARMNFTSQGPGESIDCEYPLRVSDRSADDAPPMSAPGREADMIREKVGVRGVERPM